MGWWVIWSEEHRRWWGPGRSGYVDQLEQAGRYSEAEARRIEKEANIPMDAPEFNEVAMPDPVPAFQRARVNPYDDARFTPRPCDRCGKTYRGPAVYCSLACAQADA